MLSWGRGRGKVLGLMKLFSFTVGSFSVVFQGVGFRGGGA